MADRTVRVRLEALIGGFQSAMMNASRSVTGFANTTTSGTRRAGTAMRTLGPIALGVGVAVAAGIARGVSAMTDFEESAIKLQTQIGLTADQANAMAQAARNVGRESGIGAQEAIDASFFISSAGLRGEEAMNALERSAQAARIGLGETKDIADLVTSAMNAYGSEVIDADQATDQLLMAVREGKAEAPEFAAAMGMVLPIASEMGVSFGEMAGNVAAMTRTGTNARTATIQLRQVLMGLLNPTEQARDALSEFGLSAQQLRDMIREDGLFATLMHLKDAFGENEEAMSTVFGNARSLMGVLDLMGANAEENARIVESVMTDAAGGIDDAVTLVEGTTRDKLSRLSAQWEEFWLIVGGGAQTPFDHAIDSAIAGVERLNEVLTPQGGGPTSELESRMASLEAMGYSTAEAAEYLGVAAHQAEAELDKLTGMAGIASTAIGETGDVADDSADSFDNAAAAVGGYLEALERIEDPVLKLRDAVDNLAEAEEEYELALRGSEDATMSSEEASWNLYEAISGLQQAALDGDLSFEEFTARLDYFERQGWISKDMADFLRSSVDELRGSSDQYRDGGPYTATFYADTIAAEQALERLRRAVGAIPTQRMIDVSVRHGAGASPAGLAQFHHEGGLLGQRSGRTMPFLPLGPLHSDEVPFIGLRNEEILTVDDPRHVSNLGSAQSLAPAPHGSSGGGATVEIPVMMALSNGHYREIARAQAFIDEQGRVSARRDRLTAGAN